MDWAKWQMEIKTENKKNNNNNNESIWWKNSILFLTNMMYFTSGKHSNNTENPISASLSQTIA